METGMGMGTGIEMGTGTGHASPRPAMPFPSKPCTTRANPISLCPSTNHGLEENPGNELVSLTALIPSAHPLQASCRWGPGIVQVGTSTPYHIAAATRHMAVPYVCPPPFPMSLGFGHCVG